MVDNFDDRSAKRTAYRTPIQVKDLRSGDMHQAQMLDYSDNGIFFASNGFFETGTPLYFGIQYPPPYSTSHVFEYYKGVVMWRRDLRQSRFSYGYGIRLAFASNKQDANANDSKATKEPRNYPRKPFLKPLRFGPQKEIYNGITKNISASGVFIVTDHKLKVGQLIQLNLPFKKGNMVKAVGKIVWINEEGFGLKFKKIN